MLMNMPTPQTVTDALRLYDCIYVGAIWTSDYLGTGIIL